ncbi:MAG: ATP-binding cassette domain-containing protein [Desulfobacterales bacterium]|nr:MAG: ATP-binding cassette domain-containing protein [Desulfobacterales bacterium]
MHSTLVCQNISLLRRSWDGSQHAVLNDVNAVFKAGQVTLISGLTGAGKSTLLNILAGLLRPSQGQLLAEDQPVSRWNTAHRDRWRRKVGIVFQHPRLLNELTVLENVVLPIIPRVRSIARLRQSGYEALESLGISHLAGQPGFTLSGGEQQRVSIARAIVSQPEILVADEPTAHQDDTGTAAIIQRLSEWKRPDRITIIAAHDARLQRHSNFADRQFELKGGCLKELK